MPRSVIIIGAGFGGLATAALLARDGYKVTVLEKNEQAGGRAGVFEAQGFRFDMGASWYLMPEVFERFFKSLGEKAEDYFELQRLQPSYRVFFKDLEPSREPIDVFSDLARDGRTFETFESGAKNVLKQYIQQSGYVYQTAMDQFLYRNYDSIKDFASPRLLCRASKLNMLSNMQKYVGRHFKSPELQKIMQYPLVFLGASPYNAPALYNLMSHIDFNQGVFYPKGGMNKVTGALEQIARQKGVKIKLNSPVSKIIGENGRVAGVISNGKTMKADLVISNADPYYTETALLTAADRDHSAKYWEKRTLAPSGLLIYLGVGKKFRNLRHHNLLFSKDWRQNFDQTFGSDTFPDDPSIYVCAPSQTDPTVAPRGKENLFVLVPIAAGLNYTGKQLNAFADKILKTIEKTMSLQGLRDNIEYKKLFSVKDFAQRFNSYKGTALGLSHTLNQTAIFRPSNKSKKVQGLYYVGASVQPGIGLPMCLISAELVRQRLASLEK